MSEAPRDESGTVEGRRVVLTRRAGYFQWAAIPVLVAYCIWRRHFELLLYPVGLAMYNIWTLKRPPSVVSASGISRPWHRPSFIDWSQVESVAPPELGRASCALRLVDGKTLILADIPAAKSAFVAAVGGKQLVAPAALSRRPAPPNRPKSDFEVASEVTRRAEALAIQRQQLAAEFDGLRGGRATAARDGRKKSDAADELTSPSG